MGTIVSRRVSEPCEGKPEKKPLIAAYEGEKTARAPNFEILIEDRHGMKMLKREAGASYSIVNYFSHEHFITMINILHKYGRY